MLACYTDRLSVRQGESFGLHASSGRGTCRLQVTRLGRDSTLMLDLADVDVAHHPVPPDADVCGCRWPECVRIDVPKRWPSGYYDICLADGLGGEAHHFIVVRPARPQSRALLMLATNTMHAYNFWGGANSYTDMTSLLNGSKSAAQARLGARGVLSTERPFAPFLVYAPPGTPRLLTERKRDFNEQPWLHLHGFSPHDRSAGFVHKWEHAFSAWAEAEGVTLDYCTDQDIDSDSSTLEDYACLIVVGHSEYWSQHQRDSIETFVDAGGGLAIFSGNTAYWKVRYEDDGRSFVCHKWRAFENDPAVKAAPELATHLWSHWRIGRPEAALTGLSFHFGGYHRLGGCIGRGIAGYTVADERHWSLEGADLFYGDVFGDGVPLIGYENDGCRMQFLPDGRLGAEPLLGVPADLEIIATAPATLGEAVLDRYDPIMPPDRLDLMAEALFKESGRGVEDRLLRGHAVMASFNRGKGKVFNAGTTEWAHGLAAGDPHISAITRNVLRRFGAI